MLRWLEAGYDVWVGEAVSDSIGVDTPDYGPVLGSTVYADGDAVPVSAFIQPKIEAEIAFVLGSPLAGPGVSVLDARRAIAGMTAAVEIVDSRFADWRIKLADTVADLASELNLPLGVVRILLADDHRAKFEELGQARLVLTNAVDIDGAMAQIAGTARSMGITIKG